VWIAMTKTKIKSKRQVELTQGGDEGFETFTEDAHELYLDLRQYSFGNFEMLCNVKCHKCGNVVQRVRLSIDNAVEGIYDDSIIGNHQYFLDASTTLECPACHNEMNPQASLCFEPRMFGELMEDSDSEGCELV
jgi:hypothetical protein